MFIRYKASYTMIQISVQVIIADIFWKSRRVYLYRQCYKVPQLVWFNISTLTRYNVTSSKICIVPLFVWYIWTMDLSILAKDWTKTNLKHVSSATPPNLKYQKAGSIAIIYTDIILACFVVCLFVGCLLFVCFLDGVYWDTNSLPNRFTYRFH